MTAFLEFWHDGFSGIYARWYGYCALASVDDAALYLGSLLSVDMKAASSAAGGGCILDGVVCLVGRCGEDLIFATTGHVL